MATNPWEENYSNDSNAGNEPWNENYESVEPPKRGVVDVIKDVGVTAVKGAVGLPQAIVGVADIPTGGRVGKALEGIGYRPGETQKTLDTLYSPAQQEANRKVHEADGFVDTLQAAIENPSAIATTIGESIPQMIGGAGVARGLIKAGQAAGKTVAPWAAGAVGEGVIGAGSAEESIRGQTPDGLTTPKQSLAAAASGVGTAALGALGGKISQKIGLADIDTMLAQGGANAVRAGAAKAGFVKQVIGSGISEGTFEELPQSVQEQMWQNFALGKPLTDGVGNAAALGLISGSVMGGAGGGYNAMVGKVAPEPAQKTPSTPLNNAAIEAVNQGIAPVPGGAVDAQEILGIPDATDNEPAKPPLSQAEHNLRANTVKKMETPALEAIIASAEASPPKTPSAELILSLAQAELESRSPTDTVSADYTPQPEAVDRPTIDIAPDAQPLGDSLQAGDGEYLYQGVRPGSDPNNPSYWFTDDLEEAKMWSRSTQGDKINVGEGHIVVVRKADILPFADSVGPSEQNNFPNSTHYYTGGQKGGAKSRPVIKTLDSNGVEQASSTGSPVGMDNEGVTNGTTSNTVSPALDSASVESSSDNAAGSNANVVLRHDGGSDTGGPGISRFDIGDDGAGGGLPNAGSQPGNVDQSDLATTTASTLPSKPTTSQSPATPPPASAPQADASTAAQNISETLRQSIEQLIKMRKSAGQLHLAQKLDQAVNKAKQAMKTGSGSASDFKKLAKVFKGKDDAIHVTLMSIANTLEPVKNATPKPKRQIAVPKTMSMLQYAASIGGFNRASIAAEIGRLDDMKAHKSGIFGSPAFRVTGGMTWDMIGEALAEAGYLPKNEHGQYDKADLEARLNAELSGDKQYKVDDIIDNAEAEKASKDLDAARTEAERIHLDWKQYKTIDDLWMAIDAKRFELSDAEEALAEDIIASDTVDNDFDFGTPVSAAETEAWLQGEGNGQGHQGQVNGTHAGPQGEGDQHGAERGGAQGEAERQAPGGEFALAGQTEEDIRNQEARAADTSIADRAAADRASEVPLTLAAQSSSNTGSAANQGSMFTPDGRASKAADQAQEAKPQPESKPGEFSKNKIFTQSAVDAARARLKKKLGNINSGIDPELLQDGMTLAGAYIEAGARSFADYSKAMVEDLGDAIKPYLRSLYESVRYYPGLDTAGMTPSADIDSSAPKAQDEIIGGTKDAEPIVAADVPGADQAIDPERGAGGSGTGEPLGAGVAAESKAVDSEKPVPGSVSVPGGPGAKNPGSGNGEHPPSTPRTDGVVRPASSASDDGVEHKITDEDDIGSGGLTSKFRDNVAAIKILKALDTESRAATPEERKSLARYVGFGALKGVFDKNNKQWAKQYAELRELLNDEEYDSARASILNAHYTSKPVVDSMFSAIKRMGFTSGRFLEPSVGSGNFFGMMPAAMSKSSTLHGVELDLLTSKLVQAIYPKAKIAIATGFQHYQVPSGYFDIAMGNPPFGSEAIVDRERSEYSGFSIHNYFLARMIDKVRDGGIVPVIVSHNFMDAINPKTREWIAKRANLIAAVRLPNTAFKGNAGTEVVTDILFFQKTATPEKNPAWVNASDVSIHAAKGGDPVTVSLNDYFQRNKQNILGKESTAGSMYSANEYTVEPTGNLAKQLAEFVETLPKNIYTPVERTINELDSADNTIPAGVKQGSFFVTEKGEVKQRGADIAGSQTSTTWVPQNNTAMLRMKGMISLRNLLRTQMRMELDPQFNIKLLEAHRKTLNDAYDQFNKTYEFINDQVNRSIFMDDTEYALLQAIEFDYDKGVSAKVALKNGLEERPKSAKKADILTRRVLFPFAEQMNVASANDALLASLDVKGRVDIDYMENVYGKSRAEIVKELGDQLYLDPATDDHVMSDEYLSGDVKTKLATAKKAADENHAFSRNVAALEKVIPADKLPSEIYASLGAGWIPADTFKQFATEITGSSNVDITYLAATAQWLGNITGPGDVGKMTSDFGTKDLNSFELFKLTMNGKAPEVFKKIMRDGKEVRATDIEATEAARDKVHKIKQAWESWVWNEGARTEKLAGIFNDKHNRITNREYNGDHLVLHGSNPAIVLRKHQKSAVWRGIQDRNMLLDHAVGAGKTFVGAALIMEFKRLGIARKPILVVPNHLTTQWRSEFARMYPAANVLAANPEDFSKANRQRMFSKIALGEYDAVIIGHSSLKKIGLDPAIEEGIYQEQIDEIAAAIETMKTERGDRGIVRDMETIKKNLDAKVQALRALAGERDKVVTFDELGIDGMFVDEMHEFKNLFFTTQMKRVSGLGNPKGSGKAFDMFAKVRWLTQTYGEKVPFITATGTPVSNSLSEMYTMQRYMKYDEMKREGLHLFDSWARMYGDVESLYEVAPSGVGYRISQRFSKFKNLPSLMAHYRTFADTVTLQDLKDQAHEAGKVFPVPKMIGGKPQNIVAQRSDDQRDFFGVPTVRKDEAGNTVFAMDYATAKIEQNAEAKWILSDGHTSASFETKEDAELGLVEKSLTPILDLDENSLLGQFANLAQLTRDTKGKINALSLTSLASKAGLDMRIIDPDAADFPDSKINKSIDKMMDIYKKWSKDRGTQLVFCDTSIPLSARSALASKGRRLFVLDDQGMLTHKTGTLHTMEGYEGFPFYLVQTGTKENARFTIYEPVTGTVIRRDLTSKSDAKDWVSNFLSTDANRDKWYESRSEKEPISTEQMAEYRDENDLELADDGSNEVSLEDIEGVSGASQFSVYDDIKAKLVARGVPDNQIAFIHDFNTPARKLTLFKNMNLGEVRFLFGSTPKLGAGTNVQERLVGLHHIDAPWRPSDLEQREGRIIRQGNELYKRDPDGFEVFVGRYATEQTYDTRRWQLLEHKAAGIEQLRKYSGQIEIEDVAGEAANSADMKAAASGNPLILEETKLRTEVKRLTSLQKAHGDSKYAMQRTLSHERNRVQSWLPDRLANITESIKAVDANPVSTVKGAIPSFEMDGKKTTDREAAEKRISVAVTGIRTGFAKDHKFRYRGVEFMFESGFKPGALSIESPSGTIASYNETEGVSPGGVLTRLANYVDSLPQRKESVAADLAQAQKDIASIESRMDAPFAELSALAAAQQNHGIIQRKLMKSTQIDAVPEEQRAAFQIEIAERKKALEELGYGKAIKEIEDDSSPKFSTGTPTENKQTVESITKATAKLRASWLGFKQVKIIQSVKEIPNELYLRSLRAGVAIKRDTEGVYDPKTHTAYLIADNIASPERAVWAAIHEVAGHGGIRMLGAPVVESLNNAAKNDFVTKLAQAIAANRDETFNARTHTDEAIAELAAATITGNTDAILERYGVKVPIGMRNNLLGMIKRVLDAVRSFVARVTGKQVEQVSDGEVLGLIRRMKNAVEGKAPGYDTAGELQGALASMGENPISQRTSHPNILRPAKKASMEADTSLIDKALSVPFKLVGWNRIVEPAMDRLMERMSEFVPEKIKAGLTADYGLSADYIDRKAEMKASEAAQNRKSAGLVEMLAGLTRAESRIAYQWMQEKPDTETEKALVEKLPQEGRETLVRLKKMISDMGAEAVQMGQMSRDAYERNNMAYLHRTYAKHVLNTEGAISKMLRARALKIKGNQYKGRGIFDEVSMDKIGGDGVFWRKLQEGQADKSLIGENLIRFERRDNSTDAMDALPSMESKPMGKLREVIYWPVNYPVPAKYGDWVNAGTFEVRDTKGDKLVVWRDFTPEERQRMGELDEVRYAVAQTLQMMTHDIETGRFFAWTARAYGKAKPDGRETPASESMLRSFGKDEWVQVPSSSVPGTQTKKYGALAGLYVPGAVWNDIRQTAGTRIEPFGHVHEKVLQFWKKAKTAWSPAVHMNNVMANFVIADWHDLRAVDLAEALKVWAYNKRDGYREIYQRFEDSGALGGMFLSNEALRDEITKQLESMKTELTGEQEATGEMARMAKVMHLVTMAGMVPVKGAQVYTAKMESAYQFEDAIFRLAAFTKAIRYGKSDIEAGRIARNSFLNYDINAPWIQAARHTLLPFVSFFYRALPMALNTVKSKPWKVIKLLAFWQLVSALGTMLSGGDDDEERKLLPKEKQGRVWGIVPKMVRMPWNHDDGAPYFLDIRRWVPVGDVADIEMGAGMLPPWATPGGPLIMLAEMLVANKSFFTEKEIVQDTDTQGEKLEKRLDHLFKGMLPNVPLPNPLNLQTPSGEINPLGLSQGSGQSYAWSGIEKSMLKKEGQIGEVRNTPAAIASAFGVKAAAFPVGNMQAAQQIELRKKVEGIKDTMKKISRNYNNLESSTEAEDARFEHDMDRQREKLQELSDSR